MGFAWGAIDRIAMESGAKSLDYKTRLVFEIVAVEGACDRDFVKAIRGRNFFLKWQSCHIEFDRRYS
jgi:hypothetical protein